MSGMARYVNGSAAVEIGAEEVEREQELELTQPDQRFTVLPGSRPQRGQQEQSQRVLSPLVVTAIKCAVAFVAVLFVVGLLRIAVISVAFGYASSNNALYNELDEARSEGSELEVQQAIYGSSDRITSLATDVYGMTAADGVAILDLTVPSIAEEAVEADMVLDDIQTE